MTTLQIINTVIAVSVVFGLGYVAGLIDAARTFRKSNKSRGQ